MTSTTRSFIVVTLIFHGTLTVRAQNFSLSRYEVGIAGGILVYQGDLTPMRLGSFKTLRAVITLDVSRTISPFLSLRSNLALGGLHGNDAKYASPPYRQQRNFEFRTPVIE